MKDRLLEALYFMLIICLVWISLTSIIYRFSNPDKTETQAFLHIPKSFMLDFKKGK